MIIDTWIEKSWCAVDTEREVHEQGQQLHHDEGPTLDSDISSAAVAKLRRIKPAKNNIDKNSTIMSTDNSQRHSVNLSTYVGSRK